MSRADGILKRVDRVLDRLNVTDRVVYKRVTASTGGDPLLGRGTASFNDTVLSPQPAVRVATNQYPMIFDEGGAMASDVEYLLTVSANALTRLEVNDPNVSILFMDDEGNVEQLFIVGFSSSVMNGTDIAFSLVLASKAR